MPTPSETLVTKLIERHHQPLFRQFIDELQAEGELIGEVIDRFLVEEEIFENFPLSEDVIAKIKQLVVDGLWEKFSDFAWSYFCEKELWGLIQREIDEGYDPDRDLGDHPLFQSLFTILSELVWVELNRRYTRWKEAA
jgi:hypothetical protein